MDLLLSIFDKFGFWGIFGIVILGILFLIFKYIGNKIDENQTNTINGMEKIATSITESMTKNNDVLLHSITDQQSKLIDFITSEKNNSVNQHADMLSERMELSEEIKMKLKDIMNIHNAQRAFIIEFHNSYQNLTGIPFAKYSCTYEWIEKGMISLQNKCLGLPFSSMSNVVKEILNAPEHIVIYRDMEKMEEENPSLFDMLKDVKIKAIIYSGLFDHKNQLIGCLVLEYQKTPPEDILINNLLLESAELTQVINLRYKYDTK
jgi:hypothetical protein